MLITFEMTIDDGATTVTIEAEVLPIGGGELEVVIADITAEDDHGQHEVVLSEKEEDYAVQRALDLYHFADV